MLKAVRIFLQRFRRIKLNQKSALKIQTFWRFKNMKNKYYRQILGINDDQSIYFLKEQRIDLYKIFRIILEKYPGLKKHYTFDKLKNMIILSTKYMMIRYPNPLVFKRDSN
jgi:hypothetical protein